MQSDVINQMQRVGLSDTDAHTRLVMALQMSTAVTRRLHAHINDGHAVAQVIALHADRVS
jgi:hypothetical protein